MSIQPSVAEYFNNRKRPAADDLKKVSNPSKVLVVDEVLVSKVCESTKSKHGTGTLPKKIVYIKKETNTLQTKKKLSSTNKVGQSSALKGNKGKPDGFQTDIRKSLFNVPNKKIDDKNENKSSWESFEDESVSTDQSQCPVAAEPSDDGEVTPALPGTEECKSNVHSSLKTPHQSRQELNLGNVKAPMKSRSSRMEELKAALKRFNEKKAKLEDSQNKAADPGKQEVKKFELEVIPSPLKTPTKMGHLLSPQGKLTPSRLFATPPPPQPQSPHKSPLKSPAFQRYQALVTEGRPALVLPFKYRVLAELFRSIDTITSMLFNRKETVTMTKLRPAVQEMSRKNLTEYHLGQIKTVFPNSFDFKIEKFRTGSTEKYELVLYPMLSAENTEGVSGGEVNTMGSSILLARRRTFFNALLDLTKEHHEVFLKSLDPPMNIPRSRLTRWHPEFPVDDVPDIVSAALPQPPNVERVASAKDVLEKARSLFMLNPRMERALRSVSENNAAAAPSLSRPSTPITIPSSPTLTTKSALHGVPASLLEKVRAKQAARALEAMTRTPAQAKEAVRLTRLPELARILRNLFVTEKKGVLTREMVLEKLADSYRESLSTGELDGHLKLLAEKTPGWVTFCNLRKTDYVKLSRNADMNRIMTRLEALAEEKCI